MAESVVPSASIVIKLASIAVHAEEFFSPGGHEFDKVAILSLLSDVDLKAWLSNPALRVYMPLKRSAP